jgi:hypothetical protein
MQLASSRLRPNTRSAAVFADEFDRLKGEQASKRQDLAKLIGFVLKMTLSCQWPSSPYPLQTPSE